jgi:hypothetical protein
MLAYYRYDNTITILSIISEKRSFIGKDNVMRFKTWIVTYGGLRLFTLLSVRDAVTTASQNWHFFGPEVLKEYDTNIADIFNIAETFRNVYSLTPEGPLLSTNKVLQIVALINTELVGPSPLGIRNTNQDDLTNRLTNVGTHAREFNPEFYSIEEAIMKSLFLWIGCMQIDKVCRLVDAHGKPFNKEYSMGIHSELVELSNTNPWIRKGFSSAKSFEPNQQKDKTYDWIPKDSPYWE